MFFQKSEKHTFLKTLPKKHITKLDTIFDRGLRITEYNALIQRLKETHIYTQKYITKNKRKLEKIVA